MRSVCARRFASAGVALLLILEPAGAADDDTGPDALDDGVQVAIGRDEASAAGAPDAQGNVRTPETYPSIALPVRAETSGRPARGPVLDEIIVTAQKRPQTLADVPISVSAISGEKLRDAGIENLSDLSEYAPNFKLVEGGLVPLIYMRGVGSGSNQGFEMSVGMYSDGIHLGRPHQTLQAFLDAERVEVLKGPQSILFGKNAIAGALNITSARPRDSFGGEVQASWFEPFDQGEFSGYLTGPLSDDFAGRLAFRLRDDGGYVRNITQQRWDRALEEQAARASFTFNPGGRFTLDAKLEHSQRDQHGRTYQVIDRGILNESADTPVGLNDTRDTDGTELTLLDASSLTLNARLALGEHVLELVSGYGFYDQFDRFDADSSRLDTILLDGSENYRQFSQEVRWVSPPGASWEYIVGAFYQQSDQTFGEFGVLKVRSGTVAAVGVPPEYLDTLALAGPVNLVVLTSTDLVREFTTDNRAVSAFGQATWNFHPRWRTTAGLRYVIEDKRGFRKLEAFQPGTRDPVDPATEAVLSQLLIEAHELSGERRSEVWLPMINLQHDLTDTARLYGSWTRGAKSGGYDARNNNANEGPNGGATNFEYEDEIASAWELGSKLRLAGGAAELNTALYHVSYKQMQVSVFDGVAGFTVTNAGSARVMGLEADARWLLSEQLMLSGSLALLDFEWLRYDDGPCHFGVEGNENGNCDFAGRQNQQTPRWSASLSASYRGSLSRGLDWNATLDVNYRDEHFTSGDLDPRGLQAATVKYNLRLALGPGDGRWSAALIGKNLSDELTTGIGAPVPLDTGGYMITSEPPRTFGLDLRYRF
jgi:iron complex outermembrane recepter protein